MIVSLYKPKHRATDRDEHRSYTEATCNRAGLGIGHRFLDGSHLSCPRHAPVDYADMYARHATDSISRGPISPVTGERVW